MAALKEKGSGVVPQYAWDASLERTMGNKVLDDPKLIKKSIKRREKRRPNHVPSGKNAIKMLLMLLIGKEARKFEKVDMVHQASREIFELLDLKPSNQAQQKRPGFEDEGTVH